MPIDGVRVHGAAGQPVLLLPGGAESCDGFFPGLPEGLVADPGCRVVVHDRPGTGTSATPGSLATAASHLNALINELGCGPVVVVGQSLGGAVALLLARDHPENVAGIVMLDPTPINDPRLSARVERAVRVIGPLAKIRPVHKVLTALTRASVKRTMRDLRLRPDCAAALDRTCDLDYPTLDRAVRGLTRLSADFHESELPRLPSVLITADRKPDHPVRQAHARLATALGASLLSWPGTTHNVQVDHPDETLAAVRELVARIESAT
ncbi:alpha/beta fold hydrolase [Kutzneria sp. CA-103260]|uniref:alpha/beta fold hydrolase n=1 Tax=Kutzneria sp. CA-103260 TaxID=2802641 RepID=UPI001BA670B0|nr:alpha/beta hydrolase [Kutzneria sp. CA-103260]QUQ64304.1 alpha/beta hydrolase [Kutzneria sp. CA-103260]